MTSAHTPAPSRPTVVASAPGKLMLLGEYAVLEGATALVLAVDRRAEVRLRPSAGANTRVHAPHLHLEARASGGGNLPVTWDPPDAPTGPLHLAATVLEDAAGDGPVPAVDATLSTEAFFDGAAKLGLGSSAALTVAFAAALRELAEPTSTPTLEELVAVHRATQGGRGSGTDIAASLLGGVVAYSGATTATPTATRLTLPADIHWCCVWTGRSTSTSSFLQRLAAWRKAAPANETTYRTRMRELTAIAADGARAAADGSVTALLGALQGYATALDGLGRAADLPIVGDEHRHIGQPAARCGVIYKTSGAGGGDVGIAVTDDPDRLAAFRRAIAEDYRTVDLALDPQGLTVRQQ